MNPQEDKKKKKIEEREDGVMNHEHYKSGRLVGEEDWSSGEGKFVCLIPS